MNLTQGFQLLATAPDGIARLRELILSLAVMGKLVPQDSGDESAGTLLKKIRAEKDRLVAEGKIRRDRPLAENADEEKPFALPAGWAWARMQQIADARLGKMLDKSKNSGKSYPYLRNTNVQWNRFDLEDIKGINLEAHELNEYRLRSGDLLICEGGEPGRCAIWREQQREMYFQKALHRVRPLGGILPEYVSLCLEIDAKSRRLEQYFTGATIKHFAGQELSRYCIPLPPLAEQSRIVAKVDELMCLCDGLETHGRLGGEQHARLTATLFDALAASESSLALAENWSRVAANFDLLLDRPEAVDALEETILQLAVRGLLVKQEPQDGSASDLLKQIRAEKDGLIAEGKIKRDKPLRLITAESEPFALPAGWKWARFGDIAQISSNLVDPTKHGGMRQVAPDCIEKRTGRLTEVRSVTEAGVTSPNHRFRPGQILYSKIRPSLSKAVVVDFDGLCSADMYPIDSFIDSCYLHRYILSQPFLEQVRGAENRVKMPKLNQEALNSFLVAVPPRAEQLRIVKRLAELHRLCADLRSRLVASQNCQAHTAEALIGQSAFTAPPVAHTDDLAAAD